MKTIFTVVLSGLSFLCYSQPKENKIVIGNVDSLYSNSLKENRKIWVYVPGGNSIYSQDHYPVVYLLDGDVHFNSVTGMIQNLSEVYDNTICPKMIIVGIPNTDRTRDLTPTHVTASYYGGFESSGGSENFTSFIEKELIPYIDAHYPTAPYRTLIGHSFGGLFVINTLVNHTDLFNAYVAIDPSLWWDDQKILKQAKASLGQNKFAHKSLYFAVANTMNDNMDTARVVNDTTGATLHIRSNLLFAEYLKRSQNGMHFAWKYYNNDNHGSVPLIAEYDALRFLFDYYKLPLQGDPDLLTAEIVKNHYKLVSEQLGYTLLPPESLINNDGYVFLGKKMFDKSYAFFKLNIESYPNSFNVYDSMADFYTATGDVKKVIEYLTRELTLKDTPEVRERLKKMKNEK